MATTNNDFIIEALENIVEKNEGLNTLFGSDSNAKLYKADLEYIISQIKNGKIDKFQNIKTKAWWVGVFILISFIDIFRYYPKEEQGQVINLFYWGYAIVAIIAIIDYIYSSYRKKKTG